MKSEVVLQKRYKGYDLIVKKVSYEPGHVKIDIFKPNYHRYFGYVVIPEDNPFYGVNYNPLKSFIRVSGGLSYSGRIDGIDGYVLGFDCDHTWNDPHIQIEEYALKECERLANQLLLLTGLIKEINSKDKAKEKTYRYEVYCEVDIKANTEVEARKKLKEEYSSFFHTYVGIVNEDGEVEE